jgi:hypothetical protein
MELFGAIACPVLEMAELQQQMTGVTSCFACGAGGICWMADHINHDD